MDSHNVVFEPNYQNQEKLKQLKQLKQKQKEERQKQIEKDIIEEPYNEFLKQKFYYYELDENKKNIKKIYSFEAIKAIKNIPNLFPTTAQVIKQYDNDLPDKRFYVLKKNPDLYFKCATKYLKLMQYFNFKEIKNSLGTLFYAMKDMFISKNQEFINFMEALSEHQKMQNHFIDLYNKNSNQENNFIKAFGKSLPKIAFQINEQVQKAKEIEKNQLTKEEQDYIWEQIKIENKADFKGAKVFSQWVQTEKRENGKHYFVYPIKLQKDTSIEMIRSMIPKNIKKPEKLQQQNLLPQINHKQQQKQPPFQSPNPQWETASKVIGSFAALKAQNKVQPMLGLNPLLQTRNQKFLQSPEQDNLNIGQQLVQSKKIFNNQYNNQQRYQCNNNDLTISKLCHPEDLKGYSLQKYLQEKQQLGQQLTNSELVRLKKFQEGQKNQPQGYQKNF